MVAPAYANVCCVLESSVSIVFNFVGASNHAYKTDKCLHLTVKIKIALSKKSSM